MEKLQYANYCSEFGALSYLIAHIVDANEDKSRALCKAALAVHRHLRMWIALRCVQGSLPSAVPVTDSTDLAWRIGEVVLWCLLAVLKQFFIFICRLLQAKDRQIS